MTYTTRVDGTAKEGHWVLRPRTRVWPMHSATRLVPLSNTGVPVTETVVDGTRTEAVYKIAARIPTSDPCPSTPRRVNHSLDDLKQALAALRTAGVRAYGDGRKPNHETRPLRRGRWGSIPAPCEELRAVLFRAVASGGNMMGRRGRGRQQSLGPWR